MDYLLYRKEGPMKITQKELQRIIKEETKTVLSIQGLQKQITVLKQDIKTIQDLSLIHI